MSVTVGTAPDSWGVWFPSDPKQTPWHRFLDEVVEAGYEWIELGPYGYLPTDLRILGAELEKRKLRISGTFAMAHIEDPADWPSLEKQVLGAGELVAGLGGNYFVLIDDTYTDVFTGKLRAPEKIDESGWERFVETTHKVADMVRERFDLTLVFHPHADTHVEFEDQIERFLDDTDPSRVSLCLDTGHHAYRGGEPVSFMRKHHARIPYMHLKSVDRALRERIAAQNTPFGLAVELSVFCEPSKGVVDFNAMRDVLQEIEYDGWAIVEQDMYPAPFDKPLPIAKRTRAYLKEIGIG